MRTSSAADRSTLGRIGTEEIRRTVQSDPQNLAIGRRAWITLGLMKRPVPDAIIKISVMRAIGPKSQELNNTKWTHATLGHRHDALLGATSAEGGSRASTFNPQDIAVITLWFARPELLNDNAAG